MSAVGASSPVLDQSRWAQGRRNDAEDEHDGREPQCEDEGAQCEDEGADNGDAEPDQYHMCNWQDEGDQATFRQLPVYSKRRKVKSPHQNVGEFVAVRAL